MPKLKLGDYMLEVRPTVFASLPRFFEKIHARIVADLDLAPAKERDRFNHALDIGRQVSRLRQARGPVPQGLRKAYYQEVPVLSRVKQYFGGDTTGKKVAPALLENMLKEHLSHLISQAMVYGEGKSYLVALITLNPVEAAEYARAREINQADMNCLGKTDEIGKLVQGLVNRVNARVSSTESIKKFVVLDRDFEIEKDEITPTGKLKRDVVTVHYRDVIESLYA